MRRRGPWIARCVAALAVWGATPAAPASWTLENPDPTQTFGVWVSLALDGQGQPWVAYNYGSVVRVAQRTEAGWSVDAIPMAEGPFVAATPTVSPASALLVNYVVPSLGVTTLGEPRVAYSRSSFSPGLHGHTFFAARSGGVWTQTRLTTGADFVCLALDAQDAAHVVYRDWSAGPTLADEGTSGFAQAPAPGFGSLALDASGDAHLAYAASASGEGELRYAVRTGTDWTPTPLDTVGDTGYWSSIALDSQGQPRIAYYAYGPTASNGTIRFATRDNGVWTFEPVVTGIGVTGFSLALDPSGTPCLAYYATGYDELRFARRSGGTWVSETVDHSGIPGTPPSLAFDALGRPHIGYCASTQGGVRYAVGTTVVPASVHPAVSGIDWRGLWPNPARVGAPIRLRMSLDGRRRVAIDLFDVGGRRVARESERELGPGTQDLAWSPGRLASGIYRVVVRTDRGESLDRRIAILR